MDLKIFWQNIEDAKELGEEENLKKRELFDGEKLYPYVLLLNEYLKVSSVFTLSTFGVSGLTEVSVLISSLFTGFVIISGFASSGFKLSVFCGAASVFSGSCSLSSASSASDAMRR